MSTFHAERGPYKGPAPFDRDDDGIFFGREAEANDIASLVVAARAVLIYSPSGAGKTSLLNAKVIPALQRKGFLVMPPARVRGSFPPSLKPRQVWNHYLFHTLTALSIASADIWSAKPRTLAKMSLVDFLKEQPGTKDKEGYAKPRLIIFDQFEEIFTYSTGRDEDRDVFFKELGKALGVDTGEANKTGPVPYPLRVLFAMRQED